jgi:hypothetical protein
MWEVAVDHHQVLTVSSWIICEVLDIVCDINREVYFLGDLNIDSLSSSCPLRKNRQTVTSACNLVQVVVSQPTRVVTAQELNRQHVLITFLLPLQIFALKQYLNP